HLDQVLELLVRHRRRAGAEDPRPLADHAPEVEGDDRIFDRSRGHEPAAYAERGQAPLERTAPDRIEDDGSLQLRDPLVVVGERLGAELAQTVELRLARGGGDRCPEMA